MTADLTGAALLSQRHGAPVWLIERSAAARAKASQSTVDAVLNEWVEKAGLEATSYQPPATSPTEAATSQTVPPTEGRGDAEERSDDAGGLPLSSPSDGEAAEGGGGPTLSGAALLTAVAEARGMPESLIERSANARAGAAGVSLEDVLHEWAEEEGLEAPSDQPPAASQTGADSRQPTADSPKAATSSPLPTPKPKAKPTVSVASGLTGAALLTAVAEARGMPESLVERSAKARAKKTDATVEDVLNEWAAEAGLGADSGQPTADSPKTAPAATGLTGAALLTAVAEARGMPESLVERSAAARAKKTDGTVDDVLNEWAQEAGLEDASPQSPAASPKAAPVAAGLTGAALLTAVAEARGMPESLVERSAKARAKKTDSTVEDVLNEWAEEAGLATAGPAEPTPTPSSPSGGGAAEGGGGGQALTGAALLTAVAEARGMPESLVERSAAARAKKTDGTVEDVLNEWAQEAGLVAASPQAPAASPTPAPAAAGLTGAALLTAVAEARRMPESLVERSAKARAKKTDSSLEDVLNEWAQEAGLAVASPQTPDVTSVGAEPAVVEEVQDDSQTPDADAQEVDAASEPAPRQAKSWRHAVAVGAITALVPLVILAAFAVFVDVPSNLSEMPWYLIGLEPLLGYLEPFIALVIIPGIALTSLVILAVVAWNPAVHPSTRRLALMVLVYIVLIVAVLTIIGAVQT